MLNELWPELQIIAECEHGADALDAIYTHQPDIAFLDIRMPGMSGLDVANAVKGRCHAVFTTAYDNHAPDAFAAGAIDYLLKPVAQARLAEAIARLKARLASKQAAPDLSQLMSELDKRIRGNAAERIRWISASVGDTIKMFPIEKSCFSVPMKNIPVSCAGMTKRMCASR
jgi:DNA-binding LytR/AlgR family response regulator